MKASRRSVLIGGTALALGGQAVRAQSPAPLRVTGARPTIFYTPLIAVVTQGFLKAQGVESTFHWLGATTLLDGLRGGTVDVVQSAVSNYWTLADRGEKEIPVHIAEINQRDGFFLVRKDAGPAFTWQQLEGKSIVVEMGGQPAHMLRYALRHNNVDAAKVRLVDGGVGDALRATFRNGTAEFGHFQGAIAQQVEQDGEGAIVTSVGAAMPEVAFSSVCSLPRFVQSPHYRPFLRAFAQAKAWSHATPAAEVVAHVASHFPGESRQAMINAVTAYQKLGAWSGPVGISRAHYDQSWQVLQMAGVVKGQYAFETVCVTPPSL